MAKAPAKKKAKSSAAKKKVAPKKVAKAKPAPKKAAAAKKAPPKSAKKGAKKGAAKKAAPVKVKKRLVQVKRKTVEVVSRPSVPKAVIEATNRALAQAEVEGLLRRLPPPVQPVVKTLRRLMLDAAPEATERLEDGAPAYFANGVFARIEPKEREVLVKFMRGGQLPSAAELPADGDSRVVSLSSLAELKESVLRKLVREAVMLNLSPPPPAARA